MIHLPTRSRTASPRGRLGRGHKRRPERLHVKVPEARCLMASDMVIGWDNVLIDEIQSHKISPVESTREAAILNAPIYDAANGIDRPHTPYFVAKGRAAARSPASSPPRNCATEPASPPLVAARPSPDA